MASRRRTSDRSSKLSPAAYMQITESRKRFHCDLFGFWRACRRARCRVHHRCAGDPYDCFRCHHAAIPRDDVIWPFATFLSLTAGIESLEDALRAAGQPVTGRLRPDRGKPHPSRRPWKARQAGKPARRAGPSESRAGRHFVREQGFAAPPSRPRHDSGL